MTKGSHAVSSSDGHIPTLLLFYGRLVAARRLWPNAFGFDRTEFPVLGNGAGRIGGPQIELYHPRAVGGTAVSDQGAPEKFPGQV